MIQELSSVPAENNGWMLISQQGLLFQIFVMCVPVNSAGLLTVICCFWGPLFVIFYLSAGSQSIKIGLKALQ